MSLGGARASGSTPHIHRFPRRIVLRRRIIDQLPHQYQRQTRMHFISSPLLGLPRFRHAPEPARATAVGSEMGICPRGHRACYEQQRWRCSYIFFGTPTPQYGPTLSQNDRGPPIRGQHGSNIQLSHRITAHGHGPQWSTKGLGSHALPQEIKMHKYW